ncbi:MAG: cupin domain-containing protein [Lentisphaeraceae bacterium]|nr:cupin domain-containing protein [Lentisphaeraceae bacterium]
MNIFDVSSLPLKEEFLETILNEKNFRLERIVSKGHVTPDDYWYDQEDNEWVVLLDGEATIEYKDGSRKVLKKGDSLLIPKHEEHKVVETSSSQETIWLALFWQ